MSLGQYLLGIRWRVFPVANQGTLYSLILPALLLGALSLATTVRLTRESDNWRITVPPDDYLLVSARP